MSTVNQMAKAIVGAIVAALTTLGALLVNGEDISTLTNGEWVSVAIAFFVTLSAVYFTPNAPRNP